MAKLILPFILFLLAIAASIVTDKPQPRADFTFITGADVSILDPQRMSWMQDLRVARLLYEGLARNDEFSQGCDPIPAVAERWDISEDGRTYTFYLRDDARWSNGQPVTAEHFVYSWRRAMLPDIAADYVAMFLMIQGANDFFQWRLQELEKMSSGQSQFTDGNDLWQATLDRFNNTVGLKALDDKTLQVTLEQPVPYWLDLIAFAVFYPVYPPLVRQYEPPDPTTGRLDLRLGWTKPDKLIGNGPFRLTLWRFKRDMRFEKSSTWWDVDSLAIDSISHPSINDPNASVLAFQTGSVDWVADVTPSYRGDLVADKLAFYREHEDEYQRLLAQGLDQFEIDRHLPPDPRKSLHAAPSFGTYFWNFNCKPKLVDGRDNPFHDPRVRRAFAMVVDKKAIVDQVRRMGEPVASTLVPPGSVGGYISPKGLKDIGMAKNDAERRAIAAEARALLAEAGHPDPSKFMTVELLFNKDAGHDLIGQAIAKNWAEYLGVPVRLAQKEIKVFRNDLRASNFMTSRAGWYGDYGDPTTFLDLNRTADGNNDRKYSNPKVDALLDQAAVELDPVARATLLQEVERIITEEDLPMIPIFHYVTLYLFDADNISGLTPHPRMLQTLHHIDILSDNKGSNIPRVIRSSPPPLPTATSTPPASTEPEPTT